MSLSQGIVAFDVFGDGPPVVLVHGTPSRSYIWRNVVPALAERHTVYVFDLLGFEESEKHEGMAASIPAQSRALAGMIDSWELEKPAIVGHDIGGASVPLSYLLEKVPFDPIALVDAVVLRPWITPTTRHKQSYPDAYRTMPNHIFQQTAIAHFRTATARPMAEAQFDEHYTAEFEPLHGSMQAPVRIVWGERDAWPNSASARSLHELLPDSDLELIPKTGHFVMEDAPEEVARELKDFLAADASTAEP